MHDLANPWSHEVRNHYKASRVEHIQKLGKITGGEVGLRPSWSRYRQFAECPNGRAVAGYFAAAASLRSGDGCRVELTGAKNVKGAACEEIDRALDQW